MNFPGTFYPSIAFSPEGYFLAVAHPKNTIQLWEVVTGKEVCRWSDKGAMTSSLTFAPDGRSLAARGFPRAATLWNPAPPGWRKPSKLSEAELGRLWKGLTASDPAAAYKAMWSLQAFPTEATALLRTRLRPVAAEKPDRIRTLVANLDHDNFHRREMANSKLSRLGSQAAAELRRAMEETKTSPEARARIAPLLKAAERWKVSDPEILRVLRAVWVLERIGTKEARQLLQRLANGAPAARQTVAAKAALQRLLRRRPLP